MLRRTMLLLPVPALARGNKIPTEPEDLNRFALHYNAYAESLKAGKVDLNLWRRVLSAWKRMVGEA